MKKISISLLDSKNLEEDIELVNETDEISFIHIDIMDGVYVEKTSNLLENADFSSSLKSLDIHLMCKNPLDYINNISLSNIFAITIHTDANDTLECLKVLKKRGIRCGIALNLNNPISELDDFILYVDIILIMSVNAGYGGQSFDVNTKHKIHELKNYLINNNSNALISVDGGINNNTVHECDTDIVVSGSYLLKDIKNNSKKLL